LRQELIEGDIGALLIALALLAGTAARANAQGNPDSVKHRNDCRLAEQTLTTGHPDSKTAWSLQIISSCGADGATALAAAVSSSGSSTDTSFLSNLRQQAGYFTDGDIFAAALGVAGNPAATAPSRVFALLTLQSIITPRSVNTYADATTGLDGNGAPACTRMTVSRSEAEILPGATPLPPDYLTQAHTLIVDLQKDASVPALVRAAAQCVW
jgi:hypothetical protein